MGWVGDAAGTQHPALLSGLGSAGNVGTAEPVPLSRVVMWIFLPCSWVLVGILFEISLAGSRPLAPRRLCSADPSNQLFSTRSLSSFRSADLLLASPFACGLPVSCFTLGEKTNFLLRCCVTRAPAARPSMWRTATGPFQLPKAHPALRFFQSLGTLKGYYNGYYTLKGLLCLPYSSWLCSCHHQSRAETPLKEGPIPGDHGAWRPPRAPALTAPGSHRSRRRGGGFNYKRAEEV